MLGVYTFPGDMYGWCRGLATLGVDMIKLCLRSVDVDVDAVDEDAVVVVVVVVALLSYSPLPREGGKWKAEALLPRECE